MEMQGKPFVNFDPIRQVHKILGNVVEKEVKILDTPKIPDKFSTFCTISVEVSAVLGDIQAGLGVQVPACGVASLVLIVPLASNHCCVILPRSCAPWEPCMISMLGESEFPLRRDFPHGKILVRRISAAPPCGAPGDNAAIGCHPLEMSKLARAFKSHPAVLPARYS